MLNSVEEVEEASLRRNKLWTDRTEQTGPFDIIGDVHGCAGELEELLVMRGWNDADRTEVAAMGF